MNPKPFGVDTAFPPTPPQVPPAPPGYPPYPPPGYPPAVPAQRVDRERRRNRWPLILTAGLVGAIVASTAAVAITLQSRDTTAAEASSSPAAPVTVTVPAPAPAPPVPLPTAQADRQTCQEGYLGSTAPVKAATDALAVLPVGVKVLDPMVRQNSAWADAVRSAGDLYIQAGQAIQSKIAPGTTPVLAQAAATAAKTYQVLGNSYKNFEPIAGNAHDMAQEVSDEMAALCTRLAPS